jgi:hypothetical protein
MQESPPENVEKIQELLPNYSEIEDVILWYMQYRDSKIRIVKKRIHERQ